MAAFLNICFRFTASPNSLEKITWILKGVQQGAVNLTDNNLMMCGMIEWSTADQLPWLSSEETHQYANELFNTPD